MSEIDEMNERHREAMTEKYRLEFDIHKTQATLVTGSLVAVIALQNLLIPEKPQFSLVLAASCILLVYSMAWSLAGMIGLMTAVMVSMSPYSDRELRRKQERLVTRYRWMSLGSFPLGIGLFAGYVFLNRLF